MTHDNPQLAIKQPRRIREIVTGADTHDGAGVRLTRVIPSARLRLLDPFLLLDVFRSDNPDDYIAGFPPHPHRGFETVTYLLEGQVRHRDSAGHSGVVKAGGVQWMTAGRGIEHSEMPQQKDGLLQGFQLWVNLPAAQKMRAPRYQELEPGQIPEEMHETGARIRVVTGRTARGTRGPVSGIAAEPLYLDVHLPARARYQEIVPAGHNAFIYLITGELQVTEEEGKFRSIQPDRLAVMDDGDGVEIQALEDSRFLLVAGRPIGEPVVRHGPFVMNTQEEIEQAYQDYSNGLFGQVEDDGRAVA